MRKVFGPAISLLNKLTYAYKFTLIGALFVFMTAVLIYQFTEHINNMLVPAVIFLLIGYISIACYFSVRSTAAQLMEGMRYMEAGDLTREINSDSVDEIGSLCTPLNNMAQHFSHVIGEVSEAALGITSFAGEVSVAAEQQATVASEQSAAVAEITSTMEELSASSSQIAEHSNAVVEIATKTWDDTKKGAGAVESVIMKMNDINNDNLNSIREIVELGRKSKEISKVMEIINSIADQTKLIAFNAALEASSAGEAGKRFGVVAVEIRRLADSVMESTGEIEGKINETQEAINRLVIASEKGSKGIQEGMEYSNQTADLLFGIVDAAQTTADAAKQISLSTQQQKTASGQVVAALREIVAGSSQTTDSISQISAITRTLSSLSDNLLKLVAKFKVHDSGLKEGKEDKK